MDERIQNEIDNLQESLEVEVKNWLNGLAGNAEKATLAREIIAIANNGGGRIYIGFDDNDMSAIPAGDGELDAFSQDGVAAIVNKYVSPPIQCRVEKASRTGSNEIHPVIVIPGGHRTPIFAQKGGPNDEMSNGRVYVRRPGGYSEEARTQDDWEKLLDRLVKARQGEMLDQIREVIDPSDRTLVNERDLAAWVSESYSAWEAIIGEFEQGDPRRCERGHWSAAFKITPFEPDSMTELNQSLQRDMPKYSGWPPFTYVQRDPIRPRAEGNVVTAYFGRLGDDERLEQRLRNWDFWRVSMDGFGYLLRNMYEDDPDYRSTVRPRGEGPFFDWTYPIYRSVELLKFIEKLGELFGGDDTKFELYLEYRGVKNRYLEQDGIRYNLTDGATCHVDVIRSTTSGSISEIDANVEEIVFSLLKSIYEQFDFTALPRNLVNNVTREVLAVRM